MDNEAFVKAYNESRNGCNFFVRHALARNFQYTDGVEEYAEAGCYWLLDIAATELPAVMRAKREVMAMLEVKVKGGKAKLALTAHDNELPIWSRRIDYTDMPDGNWVFELGDDGKMVSMILISEH
jgi:hypothetical protein